MTSDGLMLVPSRLNLTPGSHPQLAAAGPTAQLASGSLPTHSAVDATLRLRSDNQSQFNSVQRQPITAQHCSMTANQNSALYSNSQSQFKSVSE